MGLRTGKGNRLKWSTPEMLETLAHSISRKELVAGFRELPVRERLDVLCRLADSVALIAEGGADHGRK
jgi:hypothetical protein